MCDEYRDERMAAIWRRIERLEQQERLAPDADEVPDPLVRAESESVLVAKAKPRALMH